MKCPTCGDFYDDKACDHDGPECAGCAEEVMTSDEIGKGGDLISREQAIGAVGDERIEPLPGSEGDIAYNEAVHDCIVALRALPSIAPLGRRSDA